MPLGKKKDRINNLKKSKNKINMTKKKNLVLTKKVKIKG
jgi:hypothetical protein